MIVVASVSTVCSLQHDNRLFSFPDCHSHSSAMSRHPSVPPSITSSHRTQSCLSCPSMQCPSPPHKPAGMHSQTGKKRFKRGAPREFILMLINFFSAAFSLQLMFLSLFVSVFWFCYISTFLFLFLFVPAPASVCTSVPVNAPFSSSTQTAHFPFHPLPTTLRTRCQDSGGVGFSLAEVHQELQMLQRQLGHSDSASDCRCMSMGVC